MLQFHRGKTHYQGMWRTWRAALARFAMRRAAACQRDAPRRAGLWLRIGCLAAPTFGAPYPALVHLRRAHDDRWGALAAALDGTARFPGNPDAWMLLGDAYQMVFRQSDALSAYEQALSLEERADAAVAAGELYLRGGRPADAAARFARAYAAGGGAEALWANAKALAQAGDTQAADDALALWATHVPDGLERLPAARAELRGARRPEGT
jgi:tetratricopeptide (TPR) repeat protein